MAKIESTLKHTFPRCRDRYICTVPVVSNLFRFCVACTSVCVLFTSCAVNKYQVVETEWMDAALNVPNYSTSDSLLLLKYDLWGSGGKLRVSVKNISDSMVFLALEKSHLTANGKSYSYVADTTNLDSAVVLIYFLKNARYSYLTSDTSDLFPPANTIALIPGDSLLLEKFYLNSFTQLTLDYKNNFKPTQRFDEFDTPMFFSHQLFYSTSDSIANSSKQEFYVSSVKSWTSVRPHKIYRNSFAEQRRSRFYVRDKGVSALGTLFIMSVVVASMALGGI
ncbi:MAG: hypothetical protein ACKVOR_02655 [Flavobacteriales bacterium]